MPSNKCFSIWENVLTPGNTACEVNSIVPTLKMKKLRLQVVTGRKSFQNQEVREQHWNLAPLTPQSVFLSTRPISMLLHYT